MAIALGIDVPALMKRVGIDRKSIENPDLPVPARAVVELFEIAALISGADDFGLRLGEARGLPDLGPLTLMLREEATLRDALRTLVSLMHLHSDALYIYLSEGDTPIFVIDIIAGSQCRQAIEAGVASVIHVLRWLLGENWTPASVRFTHSPPGSRTRHVRFFRCPVDFLQECNGVVLRRRDLDRRLPASSPVLRHQVARYIQTINVAPSETYAHRVTQVVAMALPSGDAKADIIARYLGTNRQTLNRRLARAGLNYSAVLDNVRRNTAVQHMVGSDRPLSEIAQRVGFESLRAFSRWFHEAFGCTPRQWRKVNKEALR